MGKIDLNSVKRVHFIGIGGISMSGLAEILHQEGFSVSGSDSQASDATAHLKSLGIPVFVGNAAGNITPDMELVVYTAAVKPDNPELMAAKEQGVFTMDRAQLLGKIMEGFAYPVCVAGSHGKTTTTGLMAKVCDAAGLDPTVAVGGYMENGRNIRIGRSPYFVMEACEYFDSFLQWKPYVGIILNIDQDHMDYFKTMERLAASFHQFADNIVSQGTLVVYGGIPHWETVTANLSCQIVTYGTEDARFTARNVVYDPEGRPSFDIYDNDCFLLHASLQLRGAHNVLNGLAAAAAATVLGLSPQATAKGLGEAHGIKRRFEYKGIFNGVTVMDDYAHHPTEIKAALAAAKASGFKRVLCAFQPHTYTRTRHLMDEFSHSFTDADISLLLPIYASREPFAPDVSAEQLAEKIRENGECVFYAPNFEAAAACLQDLLIPGDLLITMGAGDIYLLGEMMLRTALSTLSTR